MNTKARTTIGLISNFLNLENLPDHLDSLMISVIICFTIQSISHFILSPTIFKNHYSVLSPLTKFNWDTRLVAWIHAFYATSISIYVLLINPKRFSEIHDDRLFGYNSLAMTYLTYSAGYFLWDVIVSGMMSFKGQGLGFLLHAISCFIAFFYSIKPFAGYFGFVFLLWEASTIFLNPHWYFDKLGMTGSKIQLYNGIALLITFFLSRLVLGNFTSYQLFVLALRPEVRNRVGDRLLYTILSLDVILSGLNVYWFYQMIASVKKRIKVSKLKQS